MNFFSRRLIKPEDLNPNNTLFGGRLLQWIDEEAGIYAMTKLEDTRVVTKYMSEINFVSSAHQGDVIEIGLRLVRAGNTSMTFACEVRNLFSKRTIITIDEIVFVYLDEQNRPKPHGKALEDLIKPTKHQ